MCGSPLGYGSISSTYAFSAISAALASFGTSHVRSRAHISCQRDPTALAQQRDDLRGRLLRRAGVERRLRVVLDAELDRLSDGLAGDPGDERERHVDPGGDAGGADDLAVEDDALADGVRPERAQRLEREPVARRAL